MRASEERQGWVIQPALVAQKQTGAKSGSHQLRLVTSSTALATDGPFATSLWEPKEQIQQSIWSAWPTVPALGQRCVVD